MIKLIIKDILLFLGIVGIIWSIYTLYTFEDKYISPESNTKIDSLNIIISDNNKIIERNKVIIDSLNGRKQQTINSYETTIQNYSNPTIVSDDSISRYISKELYNWK